MWISQKKIFGSPGAPVTEILTSKTLKMLMFGPKKTNVPDGILLKYAMHVISKWPQYCIFKIKFSWFSIIKSYWRRILRLGIRLVVKFGYDKNSSFLLNFDTISLHFFKNSSENHGQADSGALEHFRLTPGRQNSKNHQKSLFFTPIFDGFAQFWHYVTPFFLKTESMQLSLS